MKSDASNARRPPSSHHFWEQLVRTALQQRQVPTPFYIFSTVPIENALVELAQLDLRSEVRIRHWLSCKTQPVPALLKWWKDRGRGIEVVSSFELQAALTEGFPPDQILVNGPAKHHWLKEYPIPGLRVNFDSRSEMDALLSLACTCDWSLGVRCHTHEEFDPESPELPTQFGMQAEEAVSSIKRLARSHARIETIHFHLRTNVATPDIYGRALEDVREICRAARFHPKHVDCGGGMPPPYVLRPDGHAFNRKFNLRQLAGIYRKALRQFPGVQELWLENGRFISARSGVLVVRVLEIKERSGVRQLICNGGRTMNALISNWEAHDIFSVPRREEPGQLAAVYGPTCMAFDKLTCRPLATGIRTGDFLVWMDAGAYHIPWETHFSHGLAGVLWHEGEDLKVIRRPETFENWRKQWL